jgi:hypothetical protein
VGSLDPTLNYNYDETPYGRLNFCVRELVINGRVQDFSDSLDAVNVSPSCEENQCNAVCVLLNTQEQLAMRVSYIRLCYPPSMNCVWSQ